MSFPHGPGPRPEVYRLIVTLEDGDAVCAAPLFDSYKHARGQVSRVIQQYGRAQRVRRVAVQVGRRGTVSGNGAPLAVRDWKTLEAWDEEVVRRVLAQTVLPSEVALVTALPMTTKSIARADATFVTQVASPRLSVPSSLSAAASAPLRGDGHMLSPARRAPGSALRPAPQMARVAPGGSASRGAHVRHASLGAGWSAPAAGQSRYRRNGWRVAAVLAVLAGAWLTLACIQVGGQVPWTNLLRAGIPQAPLATEIPFRAPAARSPEPSTCGTGEKGHSGGGSVARPPDAVRKEP